MKTMSAQMPTGDEQERYATAIVYCEGNFGAIDGKTANGLVRHSEKYEILSVIDSDKAGLDAGAAGVVHVVNEGACSRMEFALEALRLVSLAERVKVREKTEPAGGPARPPYSVLDGTRYSELTGRTMRSWNEALAAYLGMPASDLQT